MSTITCYYRRELTNFVTSTALCTVQTQSWTVTQRLTGQSQFQLVILIAAPLTGGKFQGFPGIHSDLDGP